MKKEAAKQIIKKHYDVRVSTMLPATLIYRVYSESPEQAIDLIKGQNPISISHKLAGRKDLKLMVYDAGTVMLRFIKNLI